ncbi:MAG: L-threonylcarbamoyladenylate synthase [Bacteroides sp.]|nr:L-threonylcarbamoyladenylate synthase [Bacteroides sp.]MCM1413696.1 L-threonylcarbamoyladenylate synthase [Bacteroides sp.]MCM1471875.1 L-threonylcarbamoyladenylate synthase [Bacteroides sp.]
MKIPSFAEDVAAAVDCMRRGGVILYPTDTVWGIGCDATNGDAIAKVFAIKRREESKALITLVDSEAMLERHVDDAPEVAYELIEAAVKPLTIVFDNPVGVDRKLMASDGSAAFRVTSERYSQALCHGLRRPVVSTSANISGRPTPATFAQIDPEIVEVVDYVAFYRRDDDTPAQSSTVIKLSNDCTIKILRK